MASTDELRFETDGRVRLHNACVTDQNQPTFEAEWQRRAFGLAVALSEFGHYAWDDFQGELINTIDEWERSSAKALWEYYDHWVQALQTVVADHGLLLDGYIGPRQAEDDHDDGTQHTDPH